MLYKDFFELPEYIFDLTAEDCDYAKGEEKDAKRGRIVTCSISKFKPITISVYFAHYAFRPARTRRMCSC